MHVSVVSVVVHVRVLVLEWLMPVAMLVAFRHVQVRSGSEQPGCQRDERSPLAITESEGGCGAHERCQRKQ